MTDTMTKNGFTAIPNQLLEAIYSHSFTVTEMKIVLAVIRYTYGYRREAGGISVSFIATAVKCDKDHVRKCMRKLIGENILSVTRDATRTESKELGVQNDPTLWKGEVHTHPSGEVHTHPTGEVQAHPTGEVHTHPSGEVHTHPSGEVQAHPQEINNKEIYKEKDKYIALGVYKNVYMTEEEYKELRRCYRVCDVYIDKLSEYMQNKKKNYADHRATVIEWMEKDGIIMNRSTFDVDEFFLAAVEDSKRKIQSR